MTTDELLEEFEELADWEERCDYLIDIGLDLPDLPDDLKTEEHRVHGCQSNVWMTADVKTNGKPTIEFRADSDAMLVRGLCAVLMTVYNHRSPEEILSIDIRQLFTRMGLDRHLSPQRRNGLYGMVNRIRTLAEQAAQAG